MKKVLMIAVVMALTFSLTTPLLAKPRDHYRGHGVRVARGGHHKGYGGYHRGYYAPYPRSRHQSRLFFGFGLPLFAPAPVYYYEPVYAPVYYPPAYYAPAPVLAPRGYGREWVAGHYAYDRGARFWIAGSWSYSR